MTELPDTTVFLRFLSFELKQLRSTEFNHSDYITNSIENVVLSMKIPVSFCLHLPLSGLIWGLGNFKILTYV